MIEQLGEYQIKKLLGEGGMGAVYLAYQESLDRDVALKVLSERLCRNEKFIARFKREARSAASIVHPNVIQIYGIGEDEGVHYFAMEAVKGKDLADIMAEGRTFTIDETINIVVQVSEALSCASEVSIIHRDLKPANIMLTEKGMVKVTDFGLAKTSTSDLDVTEAGTIVGTANYMSPEQGQGKPLDVRSDIYSLGVVFFEMLTGRVPFVADQTSAVLYMHVYEQPDPPSKFKSDIPEAVDRMVLRMLAKQPDERPRDADVLLSELQGLRKSLGGSVTIYGGGVGRPDVIRAPGAAEKKEGIQPLKGMPTGALTALIADDVEPVRRLYAKVLSMMGFSVEEAGDGESALGIWREKRPELILLDLTMPKKDGLEILKARTEEDLGGEVIVISARSEEEVIRQVAKYNVCAYLTKPVNVNELRGRIEQIMDLPSCRAAIDRARHERPAAEPKPAAADAPAPAPRESSVVESDVQATKGQVMVYDPNPQAASLFRGVLESLGHQVVCSSNARDLLDVLTEDVPDLLVISHNGADSGADQILQTIQGMSDTVRCIIVAPEQRPDLEEKLAGLQLGPVIGKPLRVGRIRWAIERAFSEKETNNRATMSSSTFAKLVEQQMVHDNEYTIYDFGRQMAGVLSEGARKSFEQRLASGSAKDVQTAITNLLRRLNDDGKLDLGMRYVRHAYVQGNLEVRNFCLALLPELLPRNEEIEILKKVITDEDFRIRCQVLTRLGDLQAEEAGDLVVRFLNDDVWKVRKAAANCLERFDIGSVLEPLIIFYARSDEPLPDRIRNLLLGKTGANELGILDQLAAKSGAEVRMFVAKFLGELRSKLSVRLLLQLMNDRDPRVAAAAARSAGRVQNDKLQAGLYTLLTSANSEVQQAAVGGLRLYSLTPCAHVFLAGLAKRGKRISPDAVEMLKHFNQDDRSLERLLERLAHQSETNRRYLSLLLSFLFPRKEQLDPVVQALGSAQENERRQGISDVLRRLNDAIRRMARASDEHPGSAG